MSLLIGDDYPEAAHSPDREEPAPAGDLRRRPGSGGKKRDWSRWRGNRRRSMLIQDPPDLAGDGTDDGYGTDDGADDRYGATTVTVPTAVTARITVMAPTMATRPPRLTRGTDSSWVMVLARTTIRGMNTLPMVILRRVISLTVLPRTVTRNLVTPISRIPGRLPSVIVTLATRSLATRTPVMPRPAPHIQIPAIQMLPIRIPVISPLGIPVRGIPAMVIPGPATRGPGTRPKATASRPPRPRRTTRGTTARSAIRTWRMKRQAGAPHCSRRSSRAARPAIGRQKARGNSLAAPGVWAGSCWPGPQ